MFRTILLSSAAMAALTTASFAADLPARSRAPAPFIAAAPIFTWTGFYVGAQVGGAWTRDKLRETQGVALVGTGSLDDSGVVGGLHAGYNLQAGAIVYGIEGDIEAAGLSKTSASEFGANGALLGNPPTYSFGTKIDWQGSLRGRLGYSMGPTMLYVTGGVAFASIKTSYNNLAGGAFTAGSFSFSDTRAGWTLGGGLEYAFSPNWTARVEYRYTDFGNFSDVTPAGTTFWSGSNLRHDMQEHTVRVGVSYKFSTPASAVVARY